MSSASPFHVAVGVYLLSGVFFALLDATTKWLVRDHGLFVVLLSRFVGQTLVVVPFAMRRCGPGFWRTRRPALQLARSLTLVLTTAMVITGLRFLPLAEVTAIMLTSPIFVVLLARPLLGEPPTPARKIAVAAGFVGAAILVRPGTSVFHAAALVVFAGALTNAVYAILTRKLQDEPAATTLFYSGVVGVVGLALLLPWTAALEPRPAAALAPLLLPGLFAGIGHWFMIVALARVPASLLAPLTYAQVVWATLLGWLAFRQLPDPWSAAGIAIIAGSGLVFALRERAGLSRSTAAPP